MKILQIFGAVVVVHLLAFIFIFASPGCQSGPRDVPTPDATVPTASAPVSFDTGAVSVPAADPGTPVVTYTPASSSGYATPTRPGSPAAAAVMPTHVTEDVAPVTTYTVGRGDSLWSIAKKNHLTVSELAKANNIGTGVALQPGKKLIIPGKLGVVAAPKDLSTAAPLGKTAAGSVEKAAVPAGVDSVRHTVLPGESLGVIARKYQVSTGELAAANNITDPSKVRAGQSLIIPGFKAVGSKGSKKTAPAATATPAGSAPTAADTPAAPAPAPHFEITAPPPGQDLDSGLKDTSTEVPTIKVEDAKPDPTTQK